MIIYRWYLAGAIATIIVSIFLGCSESRHSYDMKSRYHLKRNGRLHLVSFTPSNMPSIEIYMFQTTERTASIIDTLKTYREDYMDYLDVRRSDTNIPERIRESYDHEYRAYVQKRLRYVGPINGWKKVAIMASLREEVVYVISSTGSEQGRVDVLAIIEDEIPLSHTDALDMFSMHALQMVDYAWVHRIQVEEQNIFDDEGSVAWEELRKKIIGYPEQK